MTGAERHKLKGAIAEMVSRYGASTRATERAYRRGDYETGRRAGRAADRQYRATLRLVWALGAS